MPDAPPGFAPEYVEGMWVMLQQETPGDLVFGTGETHSVLEWCLMNSFTYPVRHELVEGSMFSIKGSFS